MVLLFFVPTRKRYEVVDDDAAPARRVCGHAPARHTRALRWTGSGVRLVFTRNPNLETPSGKGGSRARARQTGRAPRFVEWTIRIRHRDE